MWCNWLKWPLSCWLLWRGYVIANEYDPSCVYDMNETSVCIPSFNKWFDQVFVPLIRSWTNCKVLRILDNAPAMPKQLNVMLAKCFFFSANVTSWKQSMDTRIIATLKKRYTYHLIREILSYHGSLDYAKIHLEDVAKHTQRGSIGSTLGKLTHLLDVAKLICYCLEWNQAGETF